MSSAAGMLRGRTYLTFGNAYDLAQLALLRPLRPALRSNNHMHNGAALHSKSGSDRDAAFPSVVRHVYRNLTRRNPPGTQSEPLNLSKATPARNSTESDGDRDSLYHSWLHDPVHSHKPRPCLSIFPKDVSSVEAQIPTHLQGNLLLAFTDYSGRIDTATAHACLRMYIIRSEQRAGSSRENFRDQLEEDQAGAIALSWFLNSGHHEQMESLNVGLVNAIAFCIVGGRSTSLWWDLIKSSMSPNLPGSAADSDRHRLRAALQRWNNTLLRALIETQAFWCTETTNMFNEPLRSFNTARRDFPMAPIAGAYTWLVGHMTVADKTGIDVASYDEFVQGTRHYRLTNTTQKYLDKGYLALAHPTKPDPEMMFDFFCNAALEAERLEILKVISPTRFKFMAMILAQHCHRAGRTADARAVVDSAVDVLHRGRRLSKSESAIVRKEGRLHKRKASWRELKQGIPVDASGYVIRNKIMGELVRSGKSSLY
jgi:hypothetical protein